MPGPFLGGLGLLIDGPSHLKGSGPFRIIGPILNSFMRFFKSFGRSFKRTNRSSVYFLFTLSRFHFLSPALNLIGFAGIGSGPPGFGISLLFIICSP